MHILYLIRPFTNNLRILYYRVVTLEEDTVYLDKYKNITNSINNNSVREIEKKFTKEQKILLVGSLILSDIDFIRVVIKKKEERKIFVYSVI